MNYYVHDMNPILLQIGSVRVAWYGIMYLISFVIAIFFVKRNFKKKDVKLPSESYENYMFYLLLGVIIGGRLGYILFYGLSHYISNPLNIFKVWEGGMSFHGGMLG
ncbi:MAG: prolipoprotein diacylglyceryl transferase, partial [Candidatus Cloacimonetes bacterium]|nr:prolipoprotein diacylglyceryl transferase [Candidatus Cloacimonadota bacterium]